MLFLHLFIVLAVFLAIDSVWLTSTSKLYKKELGSLMAKRPNFLYAGAFYLIYGFGVVVLALQPALADGSWWSAVWHGSLLGLFAYATYDLTNAATLKKWPHKLVFIDLAWGTFLTTIVTVIAFWIFN